MPATGRFQVYRFVTGTTAADTNLRLTTLVY